VAAAIACIPLIGGIIFYILEKHDSFVRFYAMQSIIFGCAWFLFNIVSAVVHVVFAAIPAIGGILVFFWAIIAALVHLAFLVIMIITIVKAFMAFVGRSRTLDRSPGNRSKAWPDFVERLCHPESFRD
jgi:uncharacterized membrane protein